MHASAGAFRQLPVSWRVRLYPVVSRLHYAALLLVLLSLARPQRVEHKIKGWQNGMDIQLVLDISGSMRLEDFSPNRLEAAKRRAIAFIDRRRYDRIGLVVFKDRAFTHCPLTTDYRVLREIIASVHSQILKSDATAIGTAVATALRPLEKSSAKSRIVVLLTDGRNNHGSVSPLAAARAAKELGVRIYTIGIGDPDGAVMRKGIFRQRLPAMLDEDLLSRMAELTGGIYQNAADEESLSAVMKKINTLETSKVKVERYVERFDLFAYLLLPALILLALDVSARGGWLAVYGGA